MELAKGVRDFGPEDMQLRNRVFDAIREQFRLFGFEPLETPIIERLETLNAKMEGSDATDVAKEIFKVEDQGGRELGLRYDLTVPLARYVALNKTLKLPFRRYEIGRVYRDGPIKLGRYREFVQCDADIVGASSMLADAECVNLAAAVFKSLDIDVTIKVNNRKLLNALCAKLDIDNPTDAMISIDKLEKIGRSGVAKELTSKGVTSDKVEVLLDMLLIEGTTAGKLRYFSDELGEEAVRELKELFSYLQSTVEFSPSMVRGLAYYTGSVFEVFANDSAIKSSLLGGGRYDELIGLLVKSQSQPAVGISFGIEPICEVLKERKQEAEDAETKVFVIPIGETKVKAATIVAELREHDISCAMDLLNRNVTKNIEYASKLRIPYALIVGEKDLATGQLTLKNLKTGDEKKIALTELSELALELES
jgi:histidyl-tRNA synthetase